MTKLDYYKVLGVAKSASQKEIKEAYRVMENKYHSDKNNDDVKSEEKFKLCNEAYDVLSDDNKKLEYDQSRNKTSKKVDNNKNNEASPKEYSKGNRGLGIKINWGTGITIAIICFMSFIMFMVIKMTTSKEYNHDYVTEKYYHKELEYQNDIDAIKNTKKLSEDILIQRAGNGLKIIFPSELNPTEISGKVFLYRPSNKRLDFEIPISITNTYLLVPEKNLLGGRWNIDVKFEYKGKKYLHQHKLDL